MINKQKADTVLLKKSREKLITGHCPVKKWMDALTGIRKIGGNAPEVVT